MPMSRFIKVRKQRTPSGFVNPQFDGPFTSGVAPAQIRVLQVLTRMTTRALLLLPFLFAGLALAGCSTTSRVEPTEPPARWHPLVEDDVAETLISLVHSEFRRVGFNGRIGRVPSFESPADGVPLLILNVAEWRLSRSGNAECLLNARFRTAEGEDVPLGMVSHSEFTALRGRSGLGRPFELADALEDAARGAIRELQRRLTESGQFPAMARRP
jgi:hypothetical protein